MATIVDPGYPTLLNVIKSLDPNGAVANMVELLSQKRAILEDIPWKEGNLPTGHLITSRTGLPAPTWRKYNQGIDPTKSTSVQYEETCGMLESRSDVDVKLAEFNGNAAAFRAMQDKGHLEGMSQTLETAFFYENSNTSPEKIHGLAQRYPATTGYTASSYVTKGTNSGSNCRSIWLLNWNVDKLYGVYPKGSKVGLRQEDMGKRYVVSSVNSKEMLCYTTQFNWDVGLAVEDYRYSARHQWDPDDAAYADSAKGLILALSNLVGTVFDMDETSARLYMDRTSFTKLNAQLMSNDSNLLTYVELGKRRVPSFLGIPIRVTDALVAESAIS